MCLPITYEPNSELKLKKSTARTVESIVSAFIQHLA